MRKLEALNKDLEALEKRIRRNHARIDREVRIGMANAKAEANAVRALFTGYALASRQNRVQPKTVEKIQEVVKEAQKEAQKKASAKAGTFSTRPTAATQSARPPRAFKKPKSWDSIKRYAK